MRALAGNRSTIGPCAGFRFSATSCNVAGIVAAGCAWIQRAGVAAIAASNAPSDSTLNVRLRALARGCSRHAAAARGDVDRDLVTRSFMRQMNAMRMRLASVRRGHCGTGQWAPGAGVRRGSTPVRDGSVALFGDRPFPPAVPAEDFTVTLQEIACA
jgi:hypothetical protein